MVKTRGLVTLCVALSLWVSSAPPVAAPEPAIDFPAPLPI